jgi:hypothetical protein
VEAVPPPAVVTLQVMTVAFLCKICGVHGADYEDWRLLGYINPVRTSQETLRLRYRVQPVNAMSDFRFSRR